MGFVGCNIGFHIIGGSNYSLSHSFFVGSINYGILVNGSSSNDIIINNCLFSFHISPRSSPIFVGINSNISISSSSFLENGNVNSGGSAIQILSSYCIITSFNNTFSNNISPRGAAIIVEGSPTTFHSSFDYFNNNFATTNGGAINVAQGAAAIFTSSFFSNNYCNSNGGAAYMFSTSPTIFNNCTFNNNTIVSGNGGAIYAANSNIIPTVLIINNCIFNNNNAINGGAIAAARYKINITASLFLENRGNKGSGIDAQTDARIYLFDSIIRDNYGLQSVIISLTSSLLHIMNNVTITSINNNYQGIEMLTSSLQIIGCKIENMRGWIKSDSCSSLIIDTSHFFNVTGNNGVISVKDGNITLNNNNFSKCYGIQTSIMNINNTITRINNCNFENNQGGVINSTGSEIIIERGKYINSGLNAINVRGGEIRVSRITCNTNGAGVGNGGCIKSNNAKVEIRESEMHFWWGRCYF